MSNFTNFNNAVSAADRLHWGRALAAEARAAGMDTTKLEEYLSSLNVSGERRDVEQDFETKYEGISVRAFTAWLSPGEKNSKVQFSENNIQAYPPNVLVREFNFEPHEKELRMSRKFWRRRDLKRHARRQAKYELS